MKYSSFVYQLDLDLEPTIFFSNHHVVAIALMPFLIAISITVCVFAAGVSWACEELL